MKSSSANLIPENLLADHKKRLMSEGEVTLHERELITKIIEKVSKENISLISHYYTDQKIQKITEDLGGSHISNIAGMEYFDAIIHSFTCIPMLIIYMGLMI